MRNVSGLAIAALLVLGLAAPAAALPDRAQPASQRAEPAIRVLNEQEVIDLMVGTSIQATRSSDTQSLIRQAKALLAEGRQFRLIAVDDVPADWTVVMAGGAIGGGGAWDHVLERTTRQNLPTIDNPNIRAIEALSRHLGKPFQAIIRNEAAAATLAAFQAAMLTGLPVVDACPAGRAKPEVQQSIPFITGHSVTPAALVSRWGDTIIVDKTVDDYRYEDIGRSIAVASGGRVFNARGVLTGADLRTATITGAVSEAILFARRNGLGARDRALREQVAEIALRPRHAGADRRATRGSGRRAHGSWR